MAPHLQARRYLEPTEFKLVLCIATAVAAYALVLHVNVGYNTLYFDEAGYLFVGELLLDGQSWPTRSYVFSSDFPLWLLALGQTLFGQWGGRVVALSASLLGVAALMFASRAYQPTRAYAWLLGALLVAAPAHYLNGQMATYDAVCFMLVGLTAWALSRASRSATMFDVLLVSLVMFGAVMSKYIALAFMPIVVLTFWYQRKPAAVLSVLFMGVLLALYVDHYWNDLLTLYENQIAGSHQGNSSRIPVLIIILAHLGPYLLLPAYAMIQSRPFRRHPATFVLLVSALPLPFYHLLNADIIALHKHMIYPTASLAALTILAISLGRLAPRMLIPLVLIAGVQTHWISDALNSAWPNSGNVISRIQQEVKIGDRLLSEDPYLLRYHFHEQVGIESIYDTSWIDLNGDGTHQAQDIIEAVEAGYFDFVYLDKLVTPDLSGRLVDSALGQHYSKVYEEVVQLSGLLGAADQTTIVLYQLKKPEHRVSGIDLRNER